MYKAKEDRFLFVLVNTTKSTMLQSDGESEHQEAQQMLLLVVQSHTRSLSNPLSQTNTDTDTRKQST